MTLSWVSVDARTGGVLADLPDLDVPKVSRSICRYDSTTATLPVPTAPDGWLVATRPGGAVMILLSDDVPIWGGLVTQRTRGSGDTIALALATIESYFDRRFGGDVTYTATGQNAIVADLIARYVVTGPLGGIPIRVVQVGGAGALRDRTYLDADDKTVYSCMTELAGVIGGPEFTVEWEWQHAPERITPVLYVGARIGAPVQAGLAPTAVFDLPGCVTDATFIEDFSGAGKASNDIMAVSTATAGTRPQSPLQIAADDGRPTFQYRYTPSTSISDVATLTSSAAQMLATISGGSTALTLTAAVVAAPKLGTDFVLGDDVGFVLGSTEADPRASWAPGFSDDFTDIFSDIFGELTGEMDKTLVNPSGRDSVPAFPGGFSGVARCFGWELTLGVTQTISPILVSGV